MGWLILGIFVVLVVWAMRGTWRQADVTDEVWLAESDPRRVRP